MQASDAPASIRFGTFELDVRSRELREGARRIRLQEQPFEILRLMLERPGDVVTREELCRRLWPNGTFVDFEHSLNAAVKRLRAALGDTAGAPRFVETLPRRGYRFIGRFAAEDADVDTGSGAISDVRLAVLPFNALSDDPSQQYFSDGLTEELTAQLGPLCRGRLAVIARRSAMAFKATSQRARDIARVLHARYLLEGSVRRDGDRVRITARLVDGPEETELWSDTHDRTVEDWLSVQSDVAAHVARSLMAELSPRHLPQRAAPDARAHQSYLSARSAWNLAGDDGFDDVQRGLTDTLRVAPDFGPAHALMARLRVGAAEYYREVPRDALESARAIAARALQLDPESDDARVALGDVHRMADFDWRQAKARYRDVLAANPSCEAAHRNYAFLLAIQRRHGDAIRAADLARELDPLCLVAVIGAAWTRYLAGQSDEALVICDSVSEGDGAIYVPAVRLRGFLRLAVGDERRAVSELEDMSEILAGEPQVLSALAYVYGVLGRRQKATQLISELRGLEAMRYVSPYQLALAYLSVESLDAAFGALEKAWRDRDPALGYLGVDPRMEPLRSDARYPALLDRLNLRPAAPGV